MSTIEEIKVKQFYEILKQQKIRSVFQPIVSLVDGEVYGFEALSRIEMEDCLFQTEELFQIAEKLDAVWEIEAVCRKKSLQNARSKPENSKLFINVDPNIIHDDKFKRGMTCTFLKEFGLKPEDIVFEITERTSIHDEITFQETLHHYKNQNYQVAVDDFGNGYAGLNRICSLAPDYIKIDMTIIRDIDKDAVKISLVESFVQFCSKSQTRLIAEGIETLQELKTLIKLGVLYGQGYFLQKPRVELEEIPRELKKCILEINRELNETKFVPYFFSNVSTICTRKAVTQPDVMAYKIYQMFKENLDSSEVCILDEEQRIQGVVTRRKLLEEFGGKFGYDLSSKKKIIEFAGGDTLIVHSEMSIEEVSKMALKRSRESLYDSVIVIKKNRYLGSVSVKDLLEAAIEIQVSRAVDANPLTGLSGNSVIQKKIEGLLIKNQAYSVLYFDMDNFKAYNDAYGFHNGDCMIKVLADVLLESSSQNEFVGHIGGDDFVVVTGYWDVRNLFDTVITHFREKICSLYCEEDWKNGFIRSKNRQGFEDEFPIVSLSVAVVNNRRKEFRSMQEISKELVIAKKKSKQIEGNSLIFSC